MFEATVRALLKGIARAVVENVPYVFSGPWTVLLEAIDHAMLASEGIACAVSGEQHGGLTCSYGRK